VDAAFFDVDKTVIAKASMMAFAPSFYREGLIGRRALARGLWTQLLYVRFGASPEQLTRIRESVLTVIRGWEQERVREIVAASLDAVIPPITFAEALDVIAEHRAAGRRVYLVSASPAEVIEPLARHLGVGDAVASHARVDAEGRYTGEMERYAYGPMKAAILAEVAERDGIDLSRSWAYTDSATDLPMLEAVGHPVAVNPDRTLRRVAEERGWEIRRFRTPVVLPDARQSGPSPVARAALIAPVVVLIGVTLWWRRRPPQGAMVSWTSASWRRKNRSR
jgi:HAD superfamily hydrolase (TIGR01490 family)